MSSHTENKTKHEAWLAAQTAWLAEWKAQLDKQAAEAEAAHQAWCKAQLADLERLKLYVSPRRAMRQAWLAAAAVAAGEPG
jgi:hypothetical protein